MIVAKKIERKIQRIANVFGITIIRNVSYQSLLVASQRSRVLALLEQFPSHQSEILKYLADSRAQLSQDLVALAINNFVNSGYFVEFGAADGVLHSNSLLLEKTFGWSGLLVEPVSRQFLECKNNRDATVLHAAVSGVSGRMISIRDQGLFTKSVLLESTQSEEIGRTSKNVELVKSISLDDLLNENTSPDCINFISIDTEGTELEILANFSFQRCIHFAAIEHNFSSNQLLISELLESRGFTQILAEVSEFDSWWHKECSSRSL